jgi:hypothetical protein
VLRPNTLCFAHLWEGIQRREAREDAAALRLGRRRAHSFVRRLQCLGCGVLTSEPPLHVGFIALVCYLRCAGGLVRTSRGREVEQPIRVE